MPIPDAVKHELLKIIELGLVFARASVRHAPDNAFAELDHIHNLPGVVANDSLQGLRYYFMVERVSYLDAIAPHTAPGFARSWDVIAASGLVQQVEAEREQERKQKLAKD